METRLIMRTCASPYFARFAGTEAGRGLAALQINKIAGLTDDTADALNPSAIEEPTQFLSTLIALQGPDDIAQEDRVLAIRLMRRWMARARGSFAEKTLERALMALEGNNKR